MSKRVILVDDSKTILATAQMALLQFMHAGKKTVAVPTTVHCDHLIQAKSGATEDLAFANKQSKEVFDFLSSVSNKNP